MKLKKQVDSLNKKKGKLIIGHQNNEFIIKKVCFQKTYTDKYVSFYYRKYSNKNFLNPEDTIIGVHFVHKDHLIEFLDNYNIYQEKKTFEFKYAL